MWRGPNIDVLLSELAGTFLVFYLGLDPAIPSTDRAASTGEPGVQRAFPSVLTVAVGAGGGLRAPVASLRRGWLLVGRLPDE